MTAVELEVFTKVSGNKTVTIGQMRDDILQMEQRPTEVFVTALLSLGLLTLIRKSNAYGDGGSKRKLYSNSEIADLFLN